MIGQAESILQFEQSKTDGRSAVIGNLSSMGNNQLNTISSGQMKFITEQYFNIQPSLVRDDRNVPVESACVAVYDGSSEQDRGWKPSIKWYLDNGHMVPGDCVYTPGMTPDDYYHLP